MLKMNLFDNAKFYSSVAFGHVDIAFILALYLDLAWNSLIVTNEKEEIVFCSLNAQKSVENFEKTLQFRKELREKFATKPSISGNEFHCYHLGKKAKYAFHWNHQSFMLVYNANVAKCMTGEEFYARFQNPDRLQVRQEYSFAPNYYRVGGFLFGTLPD